jgi:hypothetical protein
MHSQQYRQTRSVNESVFTYAKPSSEPFANNQEMENNFQQNKMLSISQLHHSGFFSMITPEAIARPPV